MINKKTFFLTTIPGLESASNLELCEKWGRAADFFNLPPYPDVRTFKGGIEFEAPLEFGFLLNRLLRTNTRLLLREKSFSAGHESEFVKGLKQIPWSDYFAKGSTFDFKFASKSSKISMTRQVEKCLQDQLKKINVKYQKGGTTIFVRIFRDQCNISFDLTGEASFKRGTGGKGAIASLRESTANSLLRVLFQGLSVPFELIDPMCGAGTFLIESQLMNQPLNRKFAYEDFPIFSSKKEELEKALNEIKMEGILPTQMYGFDNSEQALSISNKNLLKLPNHEISIQKADLFSKKQGVLEKTDLKRVVIINPPWGKRLPVVTQDVLTTIYDKYQPDRIGFLMPARWKFSTIPLEKVRDLAILNSGVENRFLVFA